MTGYQEVATDPSYAGQIVVMTVPHIGNYGVNEQDDQARAPSCTGFVMRSLSARDSSWRSVGAFGEWLETREIIALDEVDTRRLTRHIRARGAMPAAIGAGANRRELLEAAASAPVMTGRDLTRLVTTRKIYRLDPERTAIARVVAYDFGIKRDILTALVARDFEVHVVPAATSAGEVLALDPTGVFLSNGPGDPEPLREAITAVKELLGRVPVFGVCLGHQVLGLALGAATFKLPFGHHGGNHPVRRLADGGVEITSQNHGFAVDLWSLSEARPPVSRGLAGIDLLPPPVATSFGPVIATHQNMNDGTLEGLACLDIPAFSVQYHPEAAPGPNDASPLFDEWGAMLAEVA